MGKICSKLKLKAPEWRQWLVCYWFKKIQDNIQDINLELF